MNLLTYILDILKRTNSRSTSELYDKCSFDEWQYICQFSEYHKLINTSLELYIKLNLELQRKNLWQYACKLATKQLPDREQFYVFDKIFATNNVDRKVFAQAVQSLLTKSQIKINGLRIIGSANSGKSLLANCLVAPFICCYMNNHGSENEFFMSNMLNKSVILCEELYITVATAEDFKSVLGGQPIDIGKKFQEKQLLPRTPTIVTSNHEKFGRGHLPPIDEEALKIRCYNFRIDKVIKPHVTIEWQQLYLYLLSVLL